jgi:hypothetical protein
MNNAMARNARKYLFHHPEDHPLGGFQPLVPHMRELAGQEVAGELPTSYPANTG